MNKSTRPAANAVPSIIGSDVSIKGNLTTVGEIQLDGVIEGDVNSASLTVGEQGTVKGIVSAEEVIVKGKVSGQINGRNIRLEKTARVKGDLYHETLSIESGAYLDGKVSHKNYGAQDSSPIVGKQEDTKSTSQKSA